MVRRVFLIAALVAGIALARPAPSQAATLVVDDDKQQCPAATHASIQAAIDSAIGGDTIEVCAGTYAEQLVFREGKDSLTLRSTTPQGAIIRPPEAVANFGAIPLIWVTGAANITIEGFWITGPVPVSICAPSEIVAILVENGGSAAVQENYIAEVRPADSEVGWCYPSYGVMVRPGAENDATTVTITDNMIEHYLTGGVLAGGTGASATIMRNQILGDGPTTMGRQFSIEIRGGATAEIVENDVGRNEYTGAGEIFSTGIQVEQAAPNIRIERNRSTGNDYGIALSTISGAIVRGNQALSNAVYGIVAFADVRQSVFQSNQARA
ncbi:MAG: nitrous oxide reductase family maturation protein NosD, partial [Dehalococcoidia bacterium]